jgi:phosphatidylinositol glycan class O
MVSIRISHYSTICREEQGPYCIPTYNMSPTSSMAGPGAVAFLWLMTLITSVYIQHLLKRSDNYNGSCYILVRYLVPVGLVFNALYWTLDTIEGHHLLPATSPAIQKIHSFLSKFGFVGFIAACLFIWLTDSLSVSLQLSKENTLIHNDKIPQTLVISGVANALGASYFTFTCVVLVLLGMVQKPMGNAMLLLCFCQIGLLLEMFSLWRDKVLFLETKEQKEKNSIKLSIVPAQQPVSIPLLLLFTIVMYLTGQKFFFATGHQRTLSSIQYEVGFIGIDKVNWILSPLMILFNTYGPPVLCIFSLPLLALWKRPLLRGLESQLSRELEAIVFIYLMISLVNATGSAFIAGHLRRHSKAWKVFAPKFIYTSVEGGLGIVVLLTSILLLAISYSHYKSFLKKLENLVDNSKKIV